MDNLDIMGLDLTDIALLVEMADGKNLGQVAERLGLSASAVSHRLGRIEGRMPVPVTSRLGRELVLTDQIAAGIPFLKSALQDLRDATAMMSKPPGRLCSVGIARILAGWAETLLPEVGTLRWTVSTGNSEQIVDRVRKGSLDVGLVRTDHGFWGVELHILDEDPLVAVATPHLAGTLAIEAPETWPWVRFSDVLSHGKTVNQIFLHLGWRQMQTFEVDALESALALVLAERGVAVLPESLVVHHLDALRLAALPIPDVKWPTRTVAIVTRTGRVLPQWTEAWGEKIARRLNHCQPTRYGERLTGDIPCPITRQK